MDAIIRRAMQHRDVYGAGAKKRRHLSSEHKKQAVMAEFRRGTLHAGGSGDIVRDRNQAYAIAISEGKAGKKK